MKFCILSTLFVLVPFSLRSQVVTYEWVQRQGATDADATTAIATDGTGSSYFCGSFSGMVNFGGVTLTSKGANDAFVVRYSSAGVLLWAKQIGSPVGARGNAIAVGKNGDVYVTGFTRDTAKLFAFDSVANQIFVARYDTSGNLKWLLKSHARQSAVGTGITVSTSGTSVYLAATVKDTMRLGAMSTGITAYPGMVVGRIDTAGSVLWLKRSYAGASSRSLDAAYSVTSDTSDNVYLGGSYADTLNFVGIHLNGLPGSAPLAIITSFDSTGTVRWLHAYTNLGAQTTSLCSSRGMIYATGPSLFVMKLRTDGSVVNSVQNSGPVIGGQSIATDNTDGIFVTGQYVYSLKVGSVMLQNIAAKVYLLKFDTTLTAQWVMQTIAGAVTSPSVAADSFGRRFLAGTFSDSVRLTNFLIGTRGKTDGFVSLIEERNIVTKLHATTYCPGDTMYVDVRALGEYNTSNNFIIEISDANGSFGAPQYLKIVDTNRSFSSAVYIPTRLAAGTKYRIRTLANTPPVAGLANDSDIILNALPNAKLTPTGTVDLCENDSVKLVASGGQHYLWSTGDTTATITVNTGGTYSVTVFGSDGCDVKPGVAVVSYHLTPPVPPISRSEEGDTLHANEPGYQYQWYRNLTAIPGATAGDYIATRNGTYNVLVTDRYKCTSLSDDLVINDLEGAVRSKSLYTVSLYNDALTIASENGAQVSLELRDVLGKLVWQGDQTIAPGTTSISIQSAVMLAPSGAYYLYVRSSFGINVFKIMHTRP